MAPTRCGLRAACGRARAVKGRPHQKGSPAHAPSWRRETRGMRARARSRAAPTEGPAAVRLAPWCERGRGWRQGAGRTTGLTAERQWQATTGPLAPPRCCPCAACGRARAVRGRPIERGRSLARLAGGARLVSCAHTRAVGRHPHGACRKAACFALWRARAGAAPSRMACCAGLTAHRPAAAIGAVVPPRCGLHAACGRARAVEGRPHQKGAARSRA